MYQHITDWTLFRVDYKSNITVGEWFYCCSYSLSLFSVNHPDKPAIKYFVKVSYSCKVNVNNLG